MFGHRTTAAILRLGLRLGRVCGVGLGLVCLCQVVVTVTGVPPYILPGPLRVVRAGMLHWEDLCRHTATTLTEMGAGLVLGTFLGAASAAGLSAFRPLRRWLLPALVASQAVPVFAVAPLLVLWLGYGMGSKIAMAVLIIFFPVTASFYDGLRRTDPGWLELARVMNARPSAVLFQIRIPAALPALASGLRVAAAVAPIGAVVGEWVGAGSGLGYYMLHANARMQTDVLFAALTVLAASALGLYFAVDRAMARMVYWERPGKREKEETP